MRFIRPVAMLAALGASPAMAQGMGEAEARDLYAAGGFPISADGRNPTNRCGKPANPRITFVDVNGDGRKDALFIDQGACYGADGRWFSIATKDANGRWRQVAGATGTTRTTGTTSNGWFDLLWTSGGKAVPLRYDGTRYAPVEPGKAAPPTAPSSSPKAVAQAPTGDAAIFRAAGFVQVKGQWRSECGVDVPPDAAYDPGTIESRRDLNGDGRPEAVVTEGTTFCYGMTGQGYWIVSQRADGGWTLITQNTGIAEFLATRGVGGWPDISVGGPGFCFSVERWNGRAYVPHRREYEGKPCK
jgi:hypothetical protein